MDAGNKGSLSRGRRRALPRVLCRPSEPPSPLLVDSQAHEDSVKPVPSKDSGVFCQPPTIPQRRLPPPALSSQFLCKGICSSHD